MLQHNSTIIYGPLDEIFITAADLPKWPEFLSHYRANTYISKMSWGGIIKMCCVRTPPGLTMTWISRFEVDPDRRELRFEHLKSTFNATRGMKVVWTFTNVENNGIKVEISHELNLKWPIIGGFVAQYIVGSLFINHIATKTLAGLKRKIEAQ
jgi:ribosome-associated toxin RatA of RatAB toxin-antitoxin module